MTENKISMPEIYILGSVIINVDNYPDEITIRTVNGKEFKISTDCEDVQGASWLVLE